MRSAHGCNGIDDFYAIEARVRETASFRYPVSISIPTKLTPNWAHATAVDPSPRNGSATVRSRSRPWRRRHISGSFGGKVAGCGRSFSRFWIVSYGMNQVFPRQRTPDAAVRQRPTFDLSWYGTPIAWRSRGACPSRVKWNTNSWQSWRNRLLLIGL